MVEDLSSTNGNVAVSLSTIPPLSCELHKGTYYVFVKATKDTLVTLTSGPQNGPDILCSSTTDFIITVLAIVLLFCLCGCLVVIYYRCCTTTQRQRPQTQGDAPQGVRIERQTAEQTQEMVVQGRPAQEPQEVVVQGHIEEIQDVIVQGHVVEDSQPIDTTANILLYPTSAVEVPHAIVLRAGDENEDEVPKCL